MVFYPSYYMEKARSKKGDSINDPVAKVKIFHGFFIRLFFRCLFCGERKKGFCEDGKKTD